MSVEIHKTKVERHVQCDEIENEEHFELMDSDHDTTDLDDMQEEDGG